MSLSLVILAIVFHAASISAENWPTWRGTAGNGSTTESRFPVSWDRTNNVVWRAALPERGNSSPIVWQNRVFITQADGNRRLVICFDRKTGAILWQSGPVYDLPEETMKENNPYCAASPVTDGQRVIAFFGSAGLYCYDFEGRELWHADTGKISHPFGPASSPCLFDDLCFAYVGPGEKQSMVAVNKLTGKIVWRADALVPNADEAAKISPQGPPVGSWSTPVVIDNHSRKELIMPFAFRLRSYDVGSGKVLWQRGGLGLQTYVTPIVTDGTIIATGGTASLAVKPPPAGTADPDLVWTQPRGKFRFGSGLVIADHLYFLSENGLIECWEKNSGKIVWQERLQGPGKKGTSWSSLSRSDKLIYAPNQSGDVFVLAAEPVFKVIATNSITEPTNASLALSQSNILMRTDLGLWCFGLTAEKS